MSVVPDLQSFCSTMPIRIDPCIIINTLSSRKISPTTDISRSTTIPTISSSVDTHQCTSIPSTDQRGRCDSYLSQRNSINIFLHLACEETTVCSIESINLETHFSRKPAGIHSV